MKKALLFAATFSLTVAANASYLLWQVDESDYSNLGVEGNEYTLYATDGSGSSPYKITTTGQAGTPVQVDLGTYSTESYSFYVEVSNWDSSASTSTFVGQSAATSYSNLSGSLFTSSLSDMARVQAWHASGYTSAPEPTSGILLMVGLSLLGLKRRKV